MRKAIAITIYGIPNCDTIKRTLDWFKANNIAYTFHDHKKESITAAKLKSWFKQVGIHTIINKKSTTWKALTAIEQAALANAATAIPIILKNQSIIKRPVIENGNEIITIGFNQTDLHQKLKDL